MRSFKAVKLVIPISQRQEDIVDLLLQEFGEELDIEIEDQNIVVKGEILADYTVRNRILEVAGV